MNLEVKSPMQSKTRLLLWPLLILLSVFIVDITVETFDVVLQPATKKIPTLLGVALKLIKQELS